MKNGFTINHTLVDGTGPEKHEMSIATDDEDLTRQLEGIFNTMAEQVREIVNAKARND